jgi:hypothetical protein
MRAGDAVLRSLYGEGVFEFFHPRFQILDFALLLFQEQVFDPVQAPVDLGNILTYILDIFLAGHGALNHLGHAFNGCDGCFCHMYSSITAVHGVSMSGVAAIGVVPITPLG